MLVGDESRGEAQATAQAATGSVRAAWCLPKSGLGTKLTRQIEQASRMEERMNRRIGFLLVILTVAGVLSDGGGSSYRARGAFATSASGNEKGDQATGWTDRGAI